MHCATKRRLIIKLCIRIYMHLRIRTYVYVCTYRCDNVRYRMYYAVRRRLIIKLCRHMYVYIYIVYMHLWIFHYMYITCICVYLNNYIQVWQCEVPHVLCRKASFDQKSLPCKEGILANPAWNQPPGKYSHKSDLQSLYVTKIVASWLLRISTRHTTFQMSSWCSSSPKPPTLSKTWKRARRRCVHRWHSQQ